MGVVARGADRCRILGVVCVSSIPLADTASRVVHHVFPCFTEIFWKVAAQRVNVVAGVASDAGHRRSRTTSHPTLKPSQSLTIPVGLIVTILSGHPQICTTQIGNIRQPGDRLEPRPGHVAAISQHPLVILAGVQPQRSAELRFIEPRRLDRPNDP